MQRIEITRCTRAAAMMAALFFAGCVTTQVNENSAGRTMTHTIVLPAPSDAERASLRSSKKGEPLQVGFGREIPAEQRRIALSDLQWRSAPGDGFTATISIRSLGARSLRVALKLDRNEEGLVVVFGESNASAQATSLIGDVYWSPVTQGDTVTIELRAATRPSSAILEIPTVSHFP